MRYVVLDLCLILHLLIALMSSNINSNTNTGTCGSDLSDCCTCREFWNTRTAVPWSLTDGRTGEEYTLRQFQEQGKPVVLEFVANWCPYSWDYSENGLLSAFSKRYGPDGTWCYSAGVRVFVTIECWCSSFRHNRVR